MHEIVTANSDWASNDPIAYSIGLLKGCLRVSPISHKHLDPDSVSAAFNGASWNDQRSEQANKKSGKLATGLFRCRRTRMALPATGCAIRHQSKPHSRRSQIRRALQNGQ